MDKRKINQMLAVMITTINDTPDFTPNGILYAGMMNELSLSEYEMLMSILVESGLVTLERNEIITITTKGKELAGRINQFTSSQDQA